MTADIGTYIDGFSAETSLVERQDGGKVNNLVISSPKQQQEILSPDRFVALTSGHRRQLFGPVPRPEVEAFFSDQVKRSIRNHDLHPCKSIFLPCPHASVIQAILALKTMRMMSDEIPDK